MSEAGPAKRAPDPVYDSIGDTGKWQVLILLYLSVSKFPVGWHNLSTVFLSSPAKYWCEDPNNTTAACSPDCKEVNYDRSVFEQTMVMEWGLICDKVHYANYEQTIFMFGILLGNISFGIWADKQGRRVTLLFSVILQLASGCLAAFSPWFSLFVALRFLCAIATGGNMLTTFCVIMEIIGPSRREVYTGIIYQIPFNFGHLLLPVFAYYFRDFRWYQFSMSSFTIVLLSYFWLIPESPRWLILAGRQEEAIKILEKAAVVNNMPTEPIRGHVEDSIKARATREEVKKASVLDLMRTPNLRRNSLCIFFNWYAIGFNFYGVSQYIGMLGGNIFLNVATSALFGIPGVAFSVPACKYLGRKPTLEIANFGVAAFMGIFVLIPESMSLWKMVSASCGFFCCAMNFVTCYLYAGELFPTVARNSGMGVASVLARIGAMTSAHASSLEIFEKWLPPVVFGTFSLVALFLTFLLPETLNQPLPETLLDAENYKKKDT